MNDTVPGQNMQSLHEEPAAYPLEQELSLELPLSYQIAPLSPPPQVAVLLHAFHLELLREIRTYLGHIPFPTDLFVSTDTEPKRQAIAGYFADWAPGKLEIRVLPNRGRDVAPKLVGLADVHDNYEFVLHLHTKQSSHRSGLAGWRGYLLETLIGSPEVVHSVFEAFAQAPHIGMLAPQHIDYLRPWVRWGANYAQSAELATRMGFILPRRAPFDFPSGSMFWARSAALRPLLSLRLGFADFPEESGQTDGTLAHAIERLYFLACEHAGLSWMKIAAREQLHDQRGVVTVNGPHMLKRFLSQHSLKLSMLRDERRSVEDDPVFTTQPAKPRRVLHVLWRRALESGPLPRGRIAIVLPSTEPSRLVASVQVALRTLPQGATGWIVTPSIGETGTAGLNSALRTGFAGGADLALLLSAAGLLHPAAIAGLLRMSEAQGGRAVMEGACLPRVEPKPLDDEDLATPWADCQVLAIPRAIFAATGGFDERLAVPFAAVDLSWRARALGFAVRHCPRALFIPAPSAETETITAADGWLLSVKWGDAAAEAHCYALLSATGAAVPWPRPEAVPAEWHHYANVAHVLAQIDRSES